MSLLALPTACGALGRRFKPATLVALALTCSSQLGSSAWAQGLNWMNIGRQTPMSQFVDEDVDLFIESGNATLRDGVDGEENVWENPDSGNSGSITAVRTYTRDSQRCREMLIENRSRSYLARSTHHFCENDDGTWSWAAPAR